MSSLTELADLIPQATERLKGVAVRTPTQRNARLSNLTGCEIWVKREDLQPVRSYKLRGAYNLMSQLTDEQRAAGVICASAGNHGQGVAFSCAALGIHAIVVVPTTTPRQKRQRIVDLGQGQVDLVLEGSTYDEASHASLRMAAETGRIVVPAFNHPLTAAGQATSIVEAIQQMPRAPDVVVLPVFDDAHDEAAILAYKEAFAPRTIVTVPGREILLGGGNVHCITQQQPKGR